MAEEKATIREVHWRHVFPWLAIFRAFGVALDFKKMALGGLGVVVMSVGWTVLAYLFTSVTDSKDVRDQAERIARWPWEVDQWHKLAVSTNPEAIELLEELQKSGLRVSPETQARIGSVRFVDDLERSGVKVTPFDREKIESTFSVKNGFAIVDELMRNPPSTLWQLGTNWRFVLKPVTELVRPFRTVFGRESGFVATVFALACGLWAVVVWAFFGGAITRLAAVQVAREEKLSTREAIQFVTSKFLSYAGAPVIPLGFIAFFAFLCLVGGLISQIRWLGPIFAGVLWILPLVAGFVMALIVIGWAVGWPLMNSTISVEGSDSFDALSRSFAYVFQRPWHYLFYILLALVFGSLCSFFVLLFADLIVHMARWAVAWGGGDELATLLGQLFYYAPEASGWRPEEAVEEPSGLTYFASICCAVWMYMMFILIVGFVYSYFWSASTIIYYLLRRDVDNTEMQEVFLEGEDEDDSIGGETPTAASPVVASGPPSAASS